MKAQVLKLKVKERKALEAIITNLKAYKSLSLEAGKGLEELHKKMWDALKGFYPKETANKDCSFNYEDYELRWLEATLQSEKFKFLKEQAVADKDFDKIMKYRDLERQAIETEQKKK
jgi:hypothetical protein